MTDARHRQGQDHDEYEYDDHRYDGYAVGGGSSSVQGCGHEHEHEHGEPGPYQPRALGHAQGEQWWQQQQEEEEEVQLQDQDQVQRQLQYWLQPDQGAEAEAAQREQRRGYTPSAPAVTVTEQHQQHQQHQHAYSPGYPAASTSYAAPSSYLTAPGQSQYDPAAFQPALPLPNSYDYLPYSPTQPESYAYTQPAAQYERGSTYAHQQEEYRPPALSLWTEWLRTQNEQQQRFAQQHQPYSPYQYQGTSAGGLPRVAYSPEPSYSGAHEYPDYAQAALSPEIRQPRSLESPPSLLPLPSLPQLHPSAPLSLYASSASPAYNHLQAENESGISTTYLIPDTRSTSRGADTRSETPSEHYSSLERALRARLEAPVRSSLSQSQYQPVQARKLGASQTSLDSFLGRLPDTSASALASSSLTSGSKDKGKRGVSSEAAATAAREKEKELREAAARQVRQGHAAVIYRWTHSQNIHPDQHYDYPTCTWTEFQTEWNEQLVQDRLEYQNVQKARSALNLPLDPNPPSTMSAPPSWNDLEVSPLFAHWEAYRHVARCIWDLC